MSGCSVRHDGAGNSDAAADRVLKWVLGGAGIIGAAGFLAAAEVALATGPGFLLALAVIIISAGAGAILGFFIGFAVNWFDRLFVQNPAEITMAGCVLCAGKNTGYPPFHDNDWTFNLGGPSLAVLGPAGAGLTVQEVRTRGAPGGGPAFTVIDPTSGQPAFHCEIGSRIGDYAAIGGAAGSVAGAIAGAAIGAAICVAAGLATFGIGALVCLIIVAAMIAAGAFAGGAIGNSIGAGIGWIADEVQDLDERGEAISAGCLMNFTGRWITDSSHQHNEIHDIASAQLIECNDCVSATGSSSSGLIAAVGIGRHPSGRDP
ncbi:hypothetical protein [Aurantimonas sp. HBX-1]|uniref:hypothetical protein n=1 Tax=Aurantimonas sp. HBX-1 TaxID=2906072 RepID=UPI001F3911D6|nr:hypothetical protein [Aurantimonas sp. HBX-1]UIJ72703.1 hypothetical protein LXB15_03355 [Aurantimonas sp. HBX-1]